MIWLSFIDFDRYKIEQSINGGPVRTVGIMLNMPLGRRVVRDMAGNLVFEADDLGNALIETALWLDDEEAIDSFSETYKSRD